MWARSFLAGVLLVGLGLGCFEAWVRAIGFRPYGRPHPWGVESAKVLAGDRQFIAILGESRAQLDLDPEVVARMVGVRSGAMLAVQDSSFVPILEDLAEAPGFCGLVVCQVNETYVFDGTRSHESPSDAVVVASRNRHAVEPAEQWVQDRFDLLLALRQERLSWRYLAADLLHRRLPSESYVRFRPDRYGAADFSKCGNLGQIIDSQRDNYRHVGRPADPTEMNRFVSRILKATEAILARGGRVVFVRLPSSGEIRRVEESRYPRRTYWDRLAGAIPAPFVHFEDSAELRDYECPDETHLDAREATEFSHRFGALLARIGNRRGPILGL